ncbi:MAG: transcriptional regulator with XRE-family HTH domain [Flammeovirgaceae bacterium]|jgi:transcriptional regulator with XRE-family HTH domain
MYTIGSRINEARKLKGLTQEELAESAKVNLRTVQRVENSETEPRGKTLSLICQVLEIDLGELLKSEEKPVSKKSYANQVISLCFLLVLNLAIMITIGFLTIDSEANINSRIGAVLLSFFIPIFIVRKIQKMSGLERILKFGGGLAIYAIMAIILIGFPATFVKGLLVCIAIGLGTLYCGEGLKTA